MTIGGTSRSRELDLRVQRTGSLTLTWPSSGYYTNTCYDGLRKTNDDVVGNLDNPNPLDIIDQVTRTPRVNGQYWYLGRVIRDFQEYPIDYDIEPKSSRAAFPEPNLISIGQEAAAKTNPSAPVISVPTALAEMKDFPDLVHALGLGFLTGALESRKLRKELLELPKGQTIPNILERLKEAYATVGQRRHLYGPGGTIAAVFRDLLRPSRPYPTKAVTLVTEPFSLKPFAQLLRGLASGNITWKFAIAPVLSDLRKLLDFQAAVDKRFLYLEALRTKKQVRRRVGCGEDHYTTAWSNKTWQSKGVVIQAKERTSYTLDSWATVKWQAKWEGVRPRGDITNNWIVARRLVAGITDYESLATAWELIPWSWLTDWFTGYQDFIQAHNNTVGATAVEICYMATTTSKTEYELISKPLWVTLSSMPHASEVRKVRIVIPTALLYMPTVSMPMLTHSQWSILGSLFTLQFLKG